MIITIPINTKYLKEKYEIKSGLIDTLLEEVLPDVVARYAADDRITSVEIITDVDLAFIEEKNNKAIFTNVDIASAKSAAELAKRICDVRVSKSEIVIQTNPLYPFVSIHSISKAYHEVKSGRVNSSIGSLAYVAHENDSNLIRYNDLGILSVYWAKLIQKRNSRTFPPVAFIDLKASEMISLRSERDIELFELIINSGYQI